ncbi:MAG TPA: methyltransferase domain-containing protein [Geminicoccaceae bacterium]|nr:methyltransferase domain-containing protein [Geminicoccaceae bacterium]
MRPDVVDLQAFYRSRQGQLVRRLLARQIRTLWPDLNGLRVLGLGYPVPYLGPLAEEAERVITLMPAAQGARRWPCPGPNRAALVQEDELPLPDNSVDRVLMVHALEGSERVRAMLREVWRVLDDGGRLLAVVPNRRGLWSLSDSTPFGHGRPYSPYQLERDLNGSLFTPRQQGRALYVPPVSSGLVLRTAVAWERLGLRLGLPFAGVLLIEAEKQIYAAALREAERRRRRVPGYLPLPRRVAAAARVRDRERRRDGERPVGTGAEPWR